MMSPRSHRALFLLSTCILASLVLGLFPLHLQAAAPLQTPSRHDYFPSDILDRPLGLQPLPSGNVLITDAGGVFYTLSDAALLEVDREGKIVWQYVGEMSFPHSAQRQAGGTTLVSDTANNRVFEVDPSGKIIWTTDSWGDGTGTLSDGTHLSYPNNAERLENGNVLITDRNNNRAVEVDKDGQIAWQYAELNRPHNAHRLPNGNILVCNSEDNRVVEINPAGEIVWTFGDAFPMEWPRDAKRLPNGNTLITDSRKGRVIEATAEGQVVWSYGGLALPYTADRLSNGNTLIADNDHMRVIEVSPAGEIVWTFRNFPYTYPTTLQNGGFEDDADGDGRPDGWYPADMNAEGPVTFIWDAGTVVHGLHSAAILYKGAGRGSWLQAVAVQPGKTYSFSGYLRSDLQRGAAAYQIWFMDKLGGPIGEPITVEPILQKMTDWTEVHLDVQSPEEAAAVQIWCHILASDGKARFDDIRWGEKTTSLTLLWVGLGVAAALVVGVIVVLILRRRGKKAA